MSAIYVLGEHFYQEFDEKDIMKDELSCECAKKQIPPQLAKCKTLCKSKTPTVGIGVHDENEVNVSTSLPFTSEIGRSMPFHSS